MAISTVPAVKAKLVTLLTAASGLAGVKVTWTYPVDEDDIGQEHIHFGDVTQSEVWHALGALRREEDYTIELVILVKKYGDDPKATDDRLWVLREQVSTVLRSDPTLSGILNAWAEITQTNTTLQPLTDGWATRARLGVHCKARI